MQLQLTAQMLEPQGMSLRYVLTKFTLTSLFFLNDQFYGKWNSFKPILENKNLGLFEAHKDKGKVIPLQARCGPEGG